VVGTSFLTESEVEALGLESHGRDVLVSRLASIHQPERIRLGSHVRVDDFAILTAGDSGGIDIGDNVHIATFAALFGGGGITIESYVGVSARSSALRLRRLHAHSALLSACLLSQRTARLTL
jgi:hypothetical protein